MSKLKIVTWSAIGLLMSGTAWAGEESTKTFLSEKFITQVDFSSWIKQSHKASPDGRRFALAVRKSGKMIFTLSMVKRRLHTMEWPTQSSARTASTWRIWSQQEDSNSSSWMEKN